MEKGEVFVEDMELIAFQIISGVGSARSSYIEAIHKARDGEMEAAAALFHEGDESFLEGHHAHARLLQQQAEGKPVTIDLLLMHAEDQLMSAEAFKNIALELMSVYQKMAELVQHPQNN